MQRLIVNMQNFVFSDALRRALNEDGDFIVTIVDKPTHVVEQTLQFSANIVLMEVRSAKEYTLTERLKTRNEIKKELPSCRIVLFVDEHTERMNANRIKQAKRDGLIDAFIYGSSSTDFMVALLDTL